MALQESVGTIFCVVGGYASVREAVNANRGITTSSTAMRRSPNAFNLIRQVEVLHRAGYGSATQQFQD